MRRSRGVLNLLALAVILCLTLVGRQAWANAAPNCVTGSSGETSLQGILDGLLGAGSYNADTGCLSDAQDSTWTPLGDDQGSLLLVEIAGHRDTNSFGIITDVNDPNSQMEIFSGPDDPFEVEVNSFPSPFGFYLDTENDGTFFSNTAFNADSYDHMLAYQGDGATAFQSGPARLVGQTFLTSWYLLAFEDLRMPGADNDYNDFVVLVTNIAPVPLPAAVWLMGSALMLLAGVGFRRQRAAAAT